MKGSETVRDFTRELQSCSLCEHRCRVDRTAGKTGVCRMTVPIVASAALHPAPPASYTVFTAGCNLKCLNCKNWSISQYPDNGLSAVRGEVSPKAFAAESVSRLGSRSARAMGGQDLLFRRGAGDPSALHREDEGHLSGQLLQGGPAGRHILPESRLSELTQGLRSVQPKPGVSGQGLYSDQRNLADRLPCLGGSGSGGWG